VKIDNPAFDYDHRDHNYAAIRRPDPRIAQQIRDSLTDCHTVLNVGAGAGSYEPDGKYVVAVEPSETMRRKRLSLGRVPAINAVAGRLPFDDHSFDAVMGVLTIHHWPDLEQGLREIKRVSKKKIVLLTYDPTKLDLFWNVAYFPELIEIERRRYPKLEAIDSALGLKATVSCVRIPMDCTDGFQEAFYARPEAFLDPEVRKAQSAWGFLDKDLEKAYVKRLEDELRSGEWDNNYGQNRILPEFEGAFRLLEFTLNPEVTAN
jgi:SAM-dependent methyltransferase